MPPASHQTAEQGTQHAELQGTHQDGLQGESGEGYATDGTEGAETDPVAFWGQLVAASRARCGSGTISPGWLPSRRAPPDERERASYGALSQRRGQAKVDALPRGIRWNHTMAGIVSSQEQVPFLDRGFCSRPPSRWQPGRGPRRLQALRVCTPKVQVKASGVPFFTGRESWRRNGCEPL